MPRSLAIRPIRWKASMPPLNSVRFNYAAARAAGFTDEQIAQSLKAKRAQGIPVYVDSTEVAQARAQTVPPPQPRPQTRGGRPFLNMPFSPMNAPGITIGDAARSLPAVLGAAGGLAAGTVGGIFTGPGGVPAAMEGALYAGMIGKKLEHTITGEPLSLGGTLAEGGKQAAFEMAGLPFRAIGPMAKGAQAMMESPAARAASRVGRLGLPVGGALSHGIPGALAGAALPYAGRAAMKIATSPATEALLRSPAFQRLARQSPRLARELWAQMNTPAEPDASQP